MNKAMHCAYRGISTGVDKETGNSIYKYIDTSTGREVDFVERDGYVYKTFGRGLTVRTLSPNAVKNYASLEPERAQKAYEIELDKTKNERDAKLDLNQRVVAVHNYVLGLTDKAGLEQVGLGEDLSCYDELIYDVAGVSARIDGGEIDDLVLDDIKKSLSVVMLLLGANFSEYCLRMLGELSGHKDEEFRAYIEMLKGMIAFCG